MAPARVASAEAGETRRKPGPTAEPRCFGRASRAVPGMVRGYTPGIPLLVDHGNTETQALCLDLA